MLKLLRGGDVYRPEYMGPPDLLIADERIIALGPRIEFTTTGSALRLGRGRTGEARCAALVGIFKEHPALNGGLLGVDLARRRLSPDPDAAARGTERERVSMESRRMTPPKQTALDWIEARMGAFKALLARQDPPEWRDLALVRHRSTGATIATLSAIAAKIKCR